MTDDFTTYTNRVTVELVEPAGNEWFVNVAVAGKYGHKTLYKTGSWKKIKSELGRFWIVFHSIPNDPDAVDRELERNKRISGHIPAGHLDELHSIGLHGEVTVSHRQKVHQRGLEFSGSWEGVCAPLAPSNSGHSPI